MSGGEESGHGEVVRWDAWGGWILPWLWKCVEILAVLWPAKVLEGFLVHTMSFITQHDFEMYI